MDRRLTPGRWLRWVWTLFCTATLAAQPAVAQPTLEAPAFVVPPCAAVQDAACWATAPRVTRFARTGEGEAVVDVRLGHEQGHLTLAVSDLPPQARLTATLGLQSAPDVLKWADTVTTAGPVARLEGPPVPLGEVRALWLTLQVPGEPTPRTLLLQPEHTQGHADGVPLVLVPDLPGFSTDLRVEATPTGLAITAPAASRVTIAALDADLSAGREREIGSALLDTVDADSLLIETPPPGWYVLEARWGDAHVVTALRRRTLLVEAPADPVLIGGGLHPAPRHLEPGRGADFALAPGARVCVQEPAFEAAAILLSEELERFSGIAAPVSICTAGRGDLSVGRSTGEPESFGIQVDRRGIRLEAADLRGAVYGAVAVADLVGPDGTAVAQTVSDAPDLPVRVLFHRLQKQHRATPDPGRYRDFLRRVVTRGRYNTLVLTLRDGYAYSTHPELTSRGALSKEDLATILQAARELGLEVVPGANAPGHADWVLNTHPELGENGSPHLLCTRHPGTDSVLGDVYQELLRDFGDGRWVHLGGDEIRWGDVLYPSDVRCPRCQGTPPPVLLADFLTRQVRSMTALQRDSMLWADVFLRDWNGSREGLWRTLERLPPDVREHTVFLPWADIGDPIATLADAGLRVIHMQTGLDDARRANLPEAASRVEGAGLALFWPTPWQPDGAIGDDGLRFSWSQVILAGASAWRPEVARGSVNSQISALADHPAYLPGFVARSGPTTPLPLPRDASLWPDAPFPERAEVQGTEFQLGASVVEPGTPLTLPVGKTASRISLLQASRLDREARRATPRAFALAESWDGPPLARLTVRLVDGTTTSVDLTYGIDTWAPEGDPRSALLWGTAGTVGLLSHTRAAAGGKQADLHLHRWDWHNPTPDVPVQEMTLEVVRPGARLLLYGVTTAGP